MAVFRYQFDASAQQIGSAKKKQSVSDSDPTSYLQALEASESDLSARDMLRYW